MPASQVSAQAVYAILKPFALTREQQDAVELAPTDSPSLVVAGAGSGKTELMAVRVLWLVANGHARPDQILGLTFTRKAASELNNRIYESLLKLRDSQLWPENLGYDFTQPTIMTYNAYANGLFRENALGLGMEAESTLLTEAAAFQLAREVIVKYGAQVDARLIDVDLKLNPLVEAVLELAGAMNDNLTDSTAISEITQDIIGRFSSLPKKPGGNDFGRYAYYDQLLQPFVTTEVLAKLSDKYREEKRRLGYVDYSDQVALAARAVQTIPEVAEVQRGRFASVLLDEYQDTSYLQTKLLSSLFGRMGVLAVGDPNQSIYGWRGASSSNLATFAQDFGGSSTRFELSTSWRNPVKVLSLANHLAQDLQSPAPYLKSTSSHLVPLTLHSRSDAPQGRIQVKIDQTVQQEAESVAAWFRSEFDRAIAAGDAHPKAAVLTRTRKFMQLFREEIENLGIPVQVVGLGGLLEVPEVVDLTSALRVIHNPESGTELIRLLTGARWRIGPKDIDRLFLFAKQQNRFQRRHESVAPEDAISIVDALDLLLDERLAEKSGIPSVGLARMQNAARLFANLRTQTGLPLVEFVRLVERELWLDVEVMANPTKKHPMAHLNAFANIVANYAAGTPRPHLGALLKWLEYAQEREKYEVTTSVPEAGVVQLLTVHASKGLEWDLVAISNLTDGDFPSTGRGSSGWLANGQLPYPLRGDVDSLPVWDANAVGSQAELKKSKEDFAADVRNHLLREELRLMYVACTRPKQALLLTAAYWQPGIKKPKEISRYLHAAVELDADVVEVYDRQSVYPPCESDVNPMDQVVTTQVWPLEPLGEKHRQKVVAASELVLASLAAPRPERELDHIELLLGEREARARAVHEVPLPVRINASAFKDYLTRTEELAERMLRPTPSRPFKATRAGTIFHSLMEKRMGELGQFMVEDLDLDIEDASERLWARQLESDDVIGFEESIELLKENFARSPWANRVAKYTELEIQLAIEDNIFVCKLDAVFQETNGQYQIVDWKTGVAPTQPQDLVDRSLQLSLYRIAFATLFDIPLAQVEACFYFVSENKVVQPTGLLTVEGLRQRWAQVVSS